MVEFRQWLLKNNLWSGAVIAILVVLLLLIGRNITARVKTIKNQKQSLAARLQAIESSASLQSDAAKAEKLLAAVQNSLPPKDQLISFSKILESASKSNQLGFGFSFESEFSATDNSPGTNNFTLTNSGSYSNFLRFLRAIEDGNYFVSFNFFDLTQKEKEFEMISRGKVFSR